MGNGVQGNKGSVTVETQNRVSVVSRLRKQGVSVERVPLSLSDEEEIAFWRFSIRVL